MREIKFRAWEEENKRWLTSYEECYLDEDGVVCYMKTSGGNWETYDYIHKTKAIPNLYTGLKDKNGKEIYEGDIVVNEAKVMYKVCFGFCKKRGFTGWYAEGININYESAINNDDDSDKNSLIEVIGNIYENPELLNSDKEVQGSVARDGDSSTKAD